jgi:hypothetical protein
MATYIKGMNCNGGCGGSPCGCDCVTADIATGVVTATDFDTSYDVTGDFPCAMDVGLDVGITDPTGLGGDALFTVKANGTTIYSTGFVTPPFFDTTTIPVPSGTTTLRVELLWENNAGASRAFSFTIACVLD